jgi:single-strand DNA-binding protein
MNTITVYGNLTDDPTLRYSSTGTAVLRFCVAVTRRSYDRRSGEWVPRPPVFHRVVAFGTLAENAATLAKGTAVTVIGELADDSWTTDTGETRRQVQLEAADIAVSLRFATAQITRNPREGDRVLTRDEHTGGGDQR